VADPKRKHQETDEVARELERLAKGKAPPPPPDDADHLSIDAVLSDEQMGKPQRPKTPTARPTPSAGPLPSKSAPSHGRPDRPAVPVIRPEEPDGATEPVSGQFIFAPELAPVTDEDDAVAVPAPTADVFQRSSTGAAVPRRPNQAGTRRSLSMRRTVVPILLTNGLMLQVLGAMWFATDDDSPFRIPGIALPISLIAIGVVLLALGIANALALRHLLRAANS
jgi:hypothetical protein